MPFALSAFSNSKEFSYKSTQFSPQSTTFLHKILNLTLFIDFAPSIVATMNVATAATIPTNNSFFRPFMHIF